MIISNEIAVIPSKITAFQTNILLFKIIEKNETRYKQIILISLTFLFNRKMLNVHYLKCRSSEKCS